MVLTNCNRSRINETDARNFPYRCEGNNTMPANSKAWPQKRCNWSDLKSLTPTGQNLKVEIFEGTISRPMKGNYDGHDLTQTQAAATKFCSSYLRQMGLLPKILKHPTKSTSKKICVMSNPDFSLFPKIACKACEARLIEKSSKKTVCHFARLSRILFCSRQLDPKMAQADEKSGGLLFTRRIWQIVVRIWKQSSIGTQYTLNRMVF